MMLRPVCMLVLMFVGTVVETANPCGTNHTLVPNLSTRITSEQVIQENDNYLTEGYYSGGNDFDMTTSMSAGITACGSLTQCWMNDDIPEIAEGERDTTICCSYRFNTGNNCYKTFTIKVANCGDYRLYDLKALGTHAVGGRYCFSLQNTSTGDDKPSFTIPVIIVATVAVIITISYVFFIQWIYRNQRGPGRNNDRILVLAHGDINVPENDCGNNPWIMGRDMQTLRIHDLTEEYVYHIPNGAEGGVPPVGTKFPNEIQKTEKKRKRRRSDVCPETEMYPPE